MLIKGETVTGKGYKNSIVAAHFSTKKFSILKNSPKTALRNKTYWF